MSRLPFLGRTLFGQRHFDGTDIGIHEIPAVLAKPRSELLLTVAIAKTAGESGAVQLATHRESATAGLPQLCATPLGNRSGVVVHAAVV